MGIKSANFTQFVILINLLILGILPQSGHAEENRVKYYENLTPQMLIELLNKSKDDSKALSVQDSLIRQQAPPISAKEWLRSLPNSNNWPTGKITVLEFWSIYCGPCVASIPKNNQLAKWLESKGGIFISVHSAGEKPLIIRKFIEEHPIKYPIALDSPSEQIIYWGSKTFGEYAIRGIPTYVTIDKDGCISSYTSPTKNSLQQLLEGCVNTTEQDEFRQKTLVAFPSMWYTQDLTPGCVASWKGFVYQTDTPQLVLKQLQAKGETIKVTKNKYSAQGQTIYELSLSASAPNWGETLVDEVTFIAEYESNEQLMKIPCKIKSKNLVKCTPPNLFFGRVKAREKVERTVTLLYCDEVNRMTPKLKQVPKDIKVELCNSREKGKFNLRATFFSNTVGVHENSLVLSVVDHKGNMQCVELDYFALVD